MARQSRKFKPRHRTRRTLGESITSNSAPKIPHEKPTPHDSGWIIRPPLSSRLYQKSGLGILTSDECIVLSPMEVLFCNWHRHLPLPGENWFENELKKESDLIILVSSIQVIPTEHIFEKGAVFFSFLSL